MLIPLKPMSPPVYRMPTWPCSVETITDALLVLIYRADGIARQSVGMEVNVATEPILPAS